mmetsp:Transcript_26503/g.32683  ORF Transcript_26503/g.32683 Transcript_26503/m.32683 type:complete len:100 (+) Transcript_26503:1214-1513(+)
MIKSKIPNMNGKTLLDFSPFDLDPAPREDEALNAVEDDLRASGVGPPLRGRNTGARLCILSLNFYLSFCVQRFELTAMRQWKNYLYPVRMIAARQCGHE